MTDFVAVLSCSQEVEVLPHFVSMWQCVQSDRNARATDRGSKLTVALSVEKSGC